MLGLQELSDEEQYEAEKGNNCSFSVVFYLGQGAVGVRCSCRPYAWFPSEFRLLGLENVDELKPIFGAKCQLRGHVETRRLHVYSLRVDVFFIC